MHGAAHNYMDLVVQSYLHAGYDKRVGERAGWAARFQEGFGGGQ
jgi:hypothetical protein